MNGIQTMLVIVQISLIALIPLFAIVQTIALRPVPPDSEPQFGRKIILHLFLTITLTILLLGLTLAALAAGTFANDQFFGGTAGPSGWEKLLRYGLAFFVSGSGYSLIIWLILRYATNDRIYSRVGNRFIGFRLTFAGLLIIGTGTWGSVCVCESPIDTSQAISSFAIAVVFLPTLLIHVWLLIRRSGSPPHEPPATHD
jgi:hypothetical protein